MVLLIYGVRLPPLCQKPHINLLGRVTDQVFSESEEWDIDTVSETIASEYERATNLSINKEKQNLPIEEKRTIDVKEIREWLNFIITIISVVLGVTNSSATTINNYNYTQQVNNYYIVGMGYDAKELNTTKYRIVNRESIVRLKHDCHSIVIEKLEEGKVVRIIDKYKKWRQIIWENEDGEECMGWIQNYRLTEFKVPRNIVVSQDYGVAAMALGKGAYAIHQSGKWYTDDNIDQMLMERHLSKKARRSSRKCHVKGPKKRTEEDDERFAQSFEKMLLMAREKEGR